MRGMLTNNISNRAMELLGKEISQQELRLFPYIQYIMVNEQKIDPNKINSEERNILSDWRERGWTKGGASGLAITKEFWNAINELIWLSYVDY